jgi:hypothetical protein
VAVHTRVLSHLFLPGDGEGRSCERRGARRRACSGPTESMRASQRPNPTGLKG